MEFSYVWTNIDLILVPMNNKIGFYS